MSINFWEAKRMEDECLLTVRTAVPHSTLRNRNLGELSGEVKVRNMAKNRKTASEGNSKNAKKINLF